MNYTDYDFKYAKLILNKMNMRQEIEDILKNTNIKLGRNVKPSPLKLIQESFFKKGWIKEYKITKQPPFLRLDLYKNKVAIEIQLVDPSDCYNDYLKFLLAYNLEQIEVGIEIVYDKSVKGENLPTLERIKNDLTIYRRVISCPIWVIGLKE